MFYRHALLAAAIFATVLQAQEEDEEITESTTLLPEESVDVGSQSFLSHEKLLKAHSLADTNKDGKISMKELLELSHKTRALGSAKGMKTVFEEMDSNKDGKISFDEMQPPDARKVPVDEEERKVMRATTAHEKARFEAADLDRDGLLSKEEATGLFFPEQNEKVLEVLAKRSLEVKDKDNDGFLSPIEVWERDLGDDISALSEEEVQEFKSLDADGDGKLNLQEVMRWESGVHYTQTAMDNLIATADKNSDGHITADELTGARVLLPGTDAGYSLLEWAEHHEL
eukprot:TRINITY_DN2699_c0_g1_i3.p1 TRINITY_DN2699_c0_g1~~TRINITY_DN2699_c0_g1_i3.p1  ORF type:complete len:309 (+),score=87.14 TRINITY_DN2699_c0_g1_i3:74-928(+)